jgi:regulator of cell morphogenesis and NO signaling
MNKFTANDTIGYIVTQFPTATKILQSYRIDYCCGGDRFLIEAITEQQLDEQTLIKELNEAYTSYQASSHEDNKNWLLAPIDLLVSHILNTHHAFLYRVLPQLSELTTKILRAHGTNHSELKTVHKLFHQLKSELDSHMIKEETIQYPAIDAYLTTGSLDQLHQAIDVIGELSDEHSVAGNVLKSLREITDNYLVPEDGCQTYHKTFQLLQELELDLFTHIHLENNILFKRLQNAI